MNSNPVGAAVLWPPEISGTKSSSEERGHRFSQSRENLNDSTFIRGQLVYPILWLSRPHRNGATREISGGHCHKPVPHTIQALKAPSHETGRSIFLLKGNTNCLMRKLAPIGCTFVFLVLLLSTRSLGFAQDTRTVTEPRLRPVCVSLEAELTARGGTIAEADE